MYLDMIPHKPHKESKVSFILKQHLVSDLKRDIPNIPI